MKPSEVRRNDVSWDEWDKTKPSEVRGSDVPWDEWDNWCYRRASKPTRGKWRLGVVVVLTLIGLIAAGVKCWMMMR